MELETVPVRAGENLVLHGETVQVAVEGIVMVRCQSWSRGGYFSGFTRRVGKVA